MYNRVFEKGLNTLKEKVMTEATASSAKSDTTTTK
jgi:hypothetical protein